MPLAKSKNTVGLGNALMNDRFGKGKGADRKKVSAGVVRTGPNGESYVTNNPKEAAWVKMRSVTEQAALEEFLSTAELAGTDFTAEKLNNIKIIHTDQKNPFLLSAQEERATVRKQNANKDRLTVPRRPPWDEDTTPQELDTRERESLMDWRRGLAELQETNDLLMTPFERNLEVWRQLWRVIERSDLIVQIVDARNPLLFRSEDLERYVKQVDERKNNLLLVNKADMMTFTQRKAWAAYFKDADINYRFFSAALAKEANEGTRLSDSDSEEEDEEEDDDDDDDDADDADDDLEDVDSNASEKEVAQKAEGLSLEEAEGSKTQALASAVSEDEYSTDILTVDQLEALFLANAPEQATAEPSRKTTVGLVGYPNVGKSSTINALIGAKKVSVSATPGKTKHFQTIHLSADVLLCDCPGLVFPNFATTKGELVCSGVLPIDQLREYTGPAGLVAQRVPKPFYEAIYGLRVPIRPLEEGGTGVPTADEILRAYASARGFATTGQGQPDTARAARKVLKDFVSGKLPFCHPPPTEPAIDAGDFNRALYDVRRLPAKRRGAEPVQEAGSTSLADPSTAHPRPQVTGNKSKRLDKAFFGAQGNEAHLRMPFNHAYTAQGREAAQHALDNEDAEKTPSGRKLRALIAIEKGVDPAELRGGKKHFKGDRRKKGKGKAKAAEADD